jgi:hypothetical protein
MARQHSRKSGSDNRAVTKRTRRRTAALLGNGAFALLGITLLGLAAVVAFGVLRGPTTRPSGAISTQQNNLDSSSLATSGWIPLRSTSPADIIAAARKSDLFLQNAHDGGDHVTDLSRLGAPIYVRAMQPHGAVDGRYPDFYVLPILNSAGAVTDAAELQLNPAHTAIHVIAIDTYAQPRAHGAIIATSSAAALSALAGQRHLALRPGSTPALAYFPGDATAQETGQVVWTGGGEFPADPIWLIPSAIGRDYILGSDGRVYDVDQLPMVQLNP